MALVVTQAHAAPQRRGPHPLPVFLGLALKVTRGDPGRMTDILRGLRAYQQHVHVRPPSQAIVAAQHGATRLMLHGRSGAPVVLIPSLINGPEVLDLAPGASFVEYLLGEGFAPLTVDWGAPGPDEMTLDLDGLVQQRLLPLLAALGEPVPVIGYCLGGTIAAAAAAITPPPKLGLIAAPFAFGGYAPERRQAMLTLWDEIAPGAEASGLVPIELLNPGFWELDPARAVGKFERFGQMDPTAREARHYVLVEDWVNSGPPIPFPAAAQIFERFYGEDEPGAGRWRIGGRPVDPAALPCPVLNVISLIDRIVPAAAAPHAGDRLELDAGHVGMMVGGRARALLYEPTVRWLRSS
jgi:polyhydroxyalkanoate synthase